LLVDIVIVIIVNMTRNEYSRREQENENGRTSEGSAVQLASNQADDRYERTNRTEPKRNQQQLNLRFFHIYAYAYAYAYSS